MYAEDAAKPCNLKDSGNYATKHVPFLFFSDITATCADRVVDYATQFATDLVAPRRFSMISPNLCNDMHGGTPSSIGSVTTGDTWLKTNAGSIVSHMGATDVLFIVWDESNVAAVNTTPMMLITVGPLVKGGTVSAKAYTHEALLATFEEAFGVARLANAAQVPNPINDVWK